MALRNTAQPQQRVLPFRQSGEVLAAQLARGIAQRREIAQHQNDLFAPNTLKRINLDGAI
jgi:hypothetical protein